VLLKRVLVGRHAFQFCRRDDDKLERRAADQSPVAVVQQNRLYERPISVSSLSVFGGGVTLKVGIMFTCRASLASPGGTPRKMLESSFPKEAPKAVERGESMYERTYSEVLLRKYSHGRDSARA